MSPANFFRSGMLGICLKYAVVATFNVFCEYLYSWNLPESI